MNRYVSKKKAQTSDRCLTSSSSYIAIGGFSRSDDIYLCMRSKQFKYVLNIFCPITRHKCRRRREEKSGFQIDAGVHKVSDEKLNLKQRDDAFCDCLTPR